MPIAAEIVDRAVAVAREHDAVRIEQIEVHVGAMRQVVPEALQLAFSVMTEGTLAAGAVLVIVEVPAAAACNGCGCRFEPDIDVSFACPQCGQADVRIVGGNEIILRNVTCQTDEEVAAS